MNQKFMIIILQKRKKYEYIKRNNNGKYIHDVKI